MFYTYVLHNTKQFYIGCTNNLRRRFKEHNSDMSIATKNRGPWTLIYYEASLSKSSALKREKYLKTAWGKRYLKQRTAS